jgi:plastocyanin
MKRPLGHTVVLFTSICLLLPATTFAMKKQPRPSAQTYTVLVGLEQPGKGVDVEAYFPRSVTIHVGDTVRWVANANEIHTVTFPDGILVRDLLLPSAEVPGADPAISPLVFNPAVVGQRPPSGSDFRGGIGGFANSGIMSLEPGFVRAYDLTFVAEGTFGYFCVVHGSVMSGQVVVVNADEAVASPNQALAQGRKEMADALSLVPGVVADAADQVVPPEANEDGTVMYTVMVGYGAAVTASYGEVAIDLVQFFPDKLTVRPGDQVTFEMSPDNTMPHTVTFLNGAPEPELAVAEGGFLYLNPQVYFPAGTDVLTRTGIFSSGLMLPIPGTSYSLVIGDMKPGLEPFLCLLHDASGMTGKLTIVPRPSGSAKSH